LAKAKKKGKGFLFLMKNFLAKAFRILRKADFCSLQEGVSGREYAAFLRISGTLNRFFLVRFPDLRTATDPSPEAFLFFGF
jgi:hypothetical protein